MPSRILSPEEFTSVRDSVIADAPDGLSEQDFTRWLGPRLEQALAQVEHGGEKIPAGAGISKVGQDTREFLGGLAGQLNPATMVKGLAQAVMHPLDTGAAIIKKQAGTFSRGMEDVGAGRYSEGGAKMLGGLIPLVGPAAVDVGERIGSGDVAGGLGEATGLVGSVLGPGMVNNAMKPVRARAAGAAREGAISMMGSAIKPERSYLQRMSGAKRGGITATKRRVLETIVDEDLSDTSLFRSPVGQGIEKAQAGIDAADAARTIKAVAAKAKGPAPESAARIEQALRDSLGEAKKGSAPQQTLAQVRQFAKEVRTNPATTKKVPGKPVLAPVYGPTGVTGMERVPGKPLTKVRNLDTVELMEAGTANNKALRNMFGQKDLSPRAQALKDVQRAIAKSQDEWAGTAKESARMRDLIDARNILGIANSRIAATNPLSITDALALTTMQPLPLAASVGVKGGNLARLATLLARGGRKVGAPRAPSKLLRTLLQGPNVPTQEPE